MLDSLIIAHFFFSVIQFLLGILANGIIVVVNSIDLIKQRKMEPFDLLLCCLATSRICLQINILYSNMVIMFLIELSQLVHYFSIFTFVHELELWLATWLSVFYCAKISPIAHPVFFWLKLRISKLVPWLIFGSLLYACIISVFYRKYSLILFERSWLSFISPNATTQIEEIPAVLFAALIFEQSLPAVIFLISALLLIFSLGRHTQQMVSTSRGTRHPSTSVHISVLLSILSFLLLYLSQYMMSALFFTQIFKIRNFIFLFCMLLLGSYPSVHSIILVLGNSKLKQKAKKFLLHSKCCQ